MRRAELFTLSLLLNTLSLHLGGRAFGPPLCRGCAPATPPYKTIAHRPCLRIPAVPLQQRGCRQPNTQSDRLNGGSDKKLVKAGTVYGLVVTPMQLPSVRAYQVELSRTRSRSFSGLYGRPQHLAQPRLSGPPELQRPELQRPELQRIAAANCLGSKARLFRMVAKWRWLRNC